MSAGKRRRRGDDADNDIPKDAHDSDDEPTQYPSITPRILDILKKKHGKQLLALATARCCLSGGIMFSQFASGELLLQVFKGNHASTQRVLTAVSTVSTLQMFILGPMLGALMDSFGRKVFLVSGPAIAATICAWVASAPSVPKYVTYRLLLSMASIPMFSAFRAAMADLTDRTTEEYTLINQWVETLCAVVRIAALAVVGLLTPRQSLRVSAVMRAIACIVFAVGTTETLKSGDRIPVPWHKLKNPFATLEVYTQTPALRKAALLDVLVSLPAYNNTVGMLRRRRFQWGMREESRLALLSQVCGLASPFVVVPMLRKCGLMGTMQLSQRIAVITSLIGNTAYDRMFATEARKCGLGEGAREAASTNLELVPGLFVPNALSEVFARTVHTAPATVTVLCAGMHLANSEALHAQTLKEHAHARQNRSQSDDHDEALTPPLASSTTGPMRATRSLSGGACTSVRPPDMSKSRLFRRRMQRRRTLADAVLADTTGAREDSLGITKAKTKDCGVTPKSMAMHATTGPQGSMAPRVSASGSSKSPKLLAMEIKRGLSKHRSSSESALLVLQRPKTGTPEDTSPTYRSPDVCHRPESSVVPMCE